LTARSPTLMRCPRPKRVQASRTISEASPAETASGAVQRRGASRRERGDRGCALRLHEGGRLNSRAAERGHLRQSDRRRGTARPVLEHLALEAIVIGGMRRAARDLRAVPVAVRAGRQLPGRLGEAIVRGVMRALQALRRDPWQCPQRRPRQRYDRAPDDQRSPARAKRGAWAVNRQGLSCHDDRGSQREQVTGPGICLTRGSGPAAANLPRNAASGNARKCTART